MRWIREQLNLTQDELNEMLGLGPTQVSRYETGVSEPLPPQLVKLSKVLGVTIDWLLGLTDDPEGYYKIPDLTNDERLLLVSYRTGRLVELARELLSEHLVRQTKTPEIKSLPPGKRPDDDPGKNGR